MVEPDKSKRPLRSITISEDGSIAWSGMKSIYEVFGFIELHINPMAIKAAIRRKIESVHDEKPEQVIKGEDKKESKEVG